MKRLLMILFLGFVIQIAQAEEVNIYTSRQEFLLKPMLQKFEAHTGIEVNTLFLKNGLIERIKIEGKLSPVDVIITTDLGRLNLFVEEGFLQKVESSIINKNIPREFRSDNKLWFALSLRARIIYASKERVALGKVTEYWDLSHDEWNKKVCVRPGKHPYNLDLIGSLIENQGKAETKKWLLGIKENLARRPQGNDRAQIRAVSDGLCDLALGNSYYYAIMLRSDNKEHREAAQKIYPIFPNQAQEGTHVNISGMALARYSKNRVNAIRLMEFLTSKEAQTFYTERNHEFPINPAVKPSDFIQKIFGNFKKDLQGLNKKAQLRKQASLLVDEIKFDF